MASHPLLFETLTNKQAGAIAIATGTLTIGVALAKIVIGGQSLHIVGLACAVAFYIPLGINGWIDAHRRVLLKNWTHLAGIVWVVTLSIGAFQMASILSALLVGLPFLVTSKLSRGRLIGMGDARLLVVLAGWNGLWTQWGALTMLVLAFGTHGLFLMVRALQMRISLSDRHPLGPWLVLGSWLTWALTA